MTVGSSTGPRLAVLVSGRGRNLQALLEAVADGRIPARAAVVISDRPGVEALERAGRMGVPTEVVEPQPQQTRREYDAMLTSRLTEHGVDLVALAGFMRILSPSFVRRYRGRLLNIHPSLLPAHRGLHAQRQALEAGDRESGCTVHFVDEAVDNGGIIVQRRVPVLPGDTEESLSRRILEQEHLAFPEAVRLVLSGRVRVDATEVKR